MPKAILRSVLPTRLSPVAVTSLGFPDGSVSLGLVRAGHTFYPRGLFFWVLFALLFFAQFFALGSQLYVRSRILIAFTSLFFSNSYRNSVSNAASLVPFFIVIFSHCFCLARIPDWLKRFEYVDGSGGYSIEV